MQLEVRRLNVGEADLYREVRLRSLKDSPHAYGTTYEAAMERTPESWAAQADSSAMGKDRATFVVMGVAPVGLAALYRDEKAPSDGQLIQVWLSPDFRGSGVANRLMDAVFDWAASNDFEVVRAEVQRGNVEALRFYEKYGFNAHHDDKRSDQWNLLLTKAVATAPDMPGNQ